MGGVAAAALFRKKGDAALRTEGADGAAAGEKDRNVPDDVPGAKKLNEKGDGEEIPSVEGTTGATVEPALEVAPAAPSLNKLPKEAPFPNPSVLLVPVVVAPLLPTALARGDTAGEGGEGSSPVTPQLVVATGVLFPARIPPKIENADEPVAGVAEESTPETAATFFGRNGLTKPLPDALAAKKGFGEVTSAVAEEAAAGFSLASCTEAITPPAAARAFFVTGSSATFMDPPFLSPMLGAAAAATASSLDLFIASIVSFMAAIC